MKHSLSRPSGNLYLLLANAAGSVAYVAGASNGGWVIQQEREQGIDGLSGEPLMWAIHALPIFCCFSLLNLLWATTIVIHRQWQSVRYWLFAALIWITAVWIDFAHH